LNGFAENISSALIGQIHLRKIHMPLRRSILVVACVLVFTCMLPTASYCQSSDAEHSVAPGTPAADRHTADSSTGPDHKRLFGIIPNYRSASIPVPYQALTAGQKFKIATQDSFDRGTIILAAAFAGVGQLTNANREFGQGAAGYGRYLGTSYADYVIGDFMTEAILPVMLHQDPRYFRRGTGGTRSRLGYATEQIFWTHSDSGKGEFNFSELGGNAAAVAISNSYYPGSRTATDNVTKLSTQLGVDMASNILKEFSSDLYRKFLHRR
jgi:hypothetical protein